MECISDFICQKMFLFLCSFLSYIIYGNKPDYNYRFIGCDYCADGQAAFTKRIEISALLASTAYFYIDNTQKGLHEMIGFYNYTVIATYIGLASSVFGMTQLIDGRFRTAIFCLALSGLCDMFDGKIARSKKNRTEDEKLFGIQIDSLSDVICFGIFPAMISYVLGVRGFLGGLILTFYCIAAVIRLGFFNVLETGRQRLEGGANKYYRGLPVTSISVILPLVFLLNFLMPSGMIKYVLMGNLLVVGILFIIDFKFKKPTNKQLYTLVIIVACAVITNLLFSEYRVKHDIDYEKPLIEKIEKIAE